MQVPTLVIYNNLVQKKYLSNSLCEDNNDFFDYFFDCVSTSSGQEQK